MMSCRQHGYLLPSLATSPYHSSPPAGVLGYIPCPHIGAVCKFGLVVLLLLGHMWGPSKYVTYELVLASPAVSGVSGSSNLGGKWPYSWCLVGCCRQDLFNIALNILV